jgi:hypothetical protein
MSVGGTSKIYDLLNFISSTYNTFMNVSGNVAVTENFARVFNFELLVSAIRQTFFQTDVTRLNSHGSELLPYIKKLGVVHRRGGQRPLHKGVWCLGEQLKIN